MIQSVGEISERVGGLGETSVLLLKCGDPVLEIKDAGTQGFTVLTAATGTAVRDQIGFVCVHEILIGLHGAAGECDGKFNGSAEWMT